MIYLQLSTGQSPAECQIFARFALRQILREAEAAGVAAELLSQTGSKHAEAAMGHRKKFAGRKQKKSALQQNHCKAASH